MKFESLMHILGIYYFVSQVQVRAIPLESCSGFPKTGKRPLLRTRIAPYTCAYVKCLLWWMIRLIETRRNDGGGWRQKQGLGKQTGRDLRHMWISVKSCDSYHSTISFVLIWNSILNHLTLSQVDVTGTHTGCLHCGFICFQHPVISSRVRSQSVSLLALGEHQCLHVSTL